MKHITAVVLTKNSAATLQACIESVDFCSEILIIDDYSTDETQKIVGTLKAKLVQRHSHKDFSEQRNFALHLVQTPWVLFVDSDEVVSDALRKEIATFMTDFVEKHYKWNIKKDKLYNYATVLGEY